MSREILKALIEKEVILFVLCYYYLYYCELCNDIIIASANYEL